MKLEKKLMLRVFGASRRGKTQTLNNLIDKLISDKSYSIYMAPMDDPNSDGDRIAIFEKNKIKVGISTVGDYASYVKKPIEQLIQEECDIIIAATRTKQGTKKVFTQLAKDNGYDNQRFEKNANINKWCNKWPHKGEDFKDRKTEYLNKLNETDAQFLFDYIDSLTQ